MILNSFDDGHMAEIIIIEPASNVIGADELVLLMLQHGVTAARIIRKGGKREDGKSARRRGSQPIGDGQSDHITFTIGGRYGQATKLTRTVDDEIDPTRHCLSPHP